MSKMNQKGFSALEVILVLVIVGLIGGIGFYTYRNQTKDSSKNDTASQEQKPEDGTPVAQNNDETADWKEVKQETYNFSYKYPVTDSCEDFIIETVKTSQLYSLGERINNSGVRCKVSVQATSSPLSVRVAVAGTSSDQPDFGDKQMQGNNYYTLVGKTPVKKGNVSGTRWEYKPGDDSSAKVVYYYFKHKDLGYVVVINDNGQKFGAFDITERGEKIFSTFQFLN